MNSLVSVIIPVYNCEDYLQKTLESVRAQSYEHLDIILIDDGSKDRSGKICDDYCLKDSRFKVIHQTNSGPGLARNAGLKVAKGEFVCFIDAGDYFHSRAIEELLGQMNQGTDLVLMGLKKTDSLNENTSIGLGVVNTVDVSQEQLVFNLVSTVGDAVFPWSVVWNKMYRKSVIADLFFSNLKCNEDQEFNLRVYLRIKKAVFIESALYFYFQSPNSIVRNPSTRPERLYIQTMSRYRMLGFLTEGDNPKYNGWMLDYLYQQMLIRRDTVKRTSIEPDFHRLSSDVLRHTFVNYLLNSNIRGKRKIKFVLKWWRLI